MGSVGAKSLLILGGPATGILTTPAACLPAQSTGTAIPKLCACSMHILLLHTVIWMPSV